MTDTAKKAANLWPNDVGYQVTRDQLLRQGEGYQPQMYLDTVGIPTIGDGWSLIAKPNKYHPNEFAVDDKAVAALVGSSTSTEYRRLMADLELVALILSTTGKPDYPIENGRPVRSLSEFQITERGMALERFFGELSGSGGGFQPADWVVRPDAAAMQRLGAYKMSTEEAKLNAMLIKNGLDSVEISAEQRAALLSMTWNARVETAVEVVRGIAAGKTNEELCQIVASTAPTPNRANLECSALTNGAIDQFVENRGTKVLKKSDLEGILEELVPLSSTMVAGGTASTDAEALENALARQRLREALSTLADDYEDREFKVYADGDQLYLAEDYTTLTLRRDGTSTEWWENDSATTAIRRNSDGGIDHVEISGDDGEGNATQVAYDYDPFGNLTNKTTKESDVDGNTQVETQNLAPDVINQAQARVGTPSAPQTRRDPLALDLDGDGLITTTSNRSNGIHFDHDGNGFAESSGWVAPQDGLLAWDRNSNGTIDTGNELFGDQTILRSGAKASSGLQALAEWDTNKDGKIDAADTHFGDLRVWRDLNQDGTSQANELQSLTDAGVASISLAGVAPTPSDPNTLANAAAGNPVSRTGSFTRTDGSNGIAAEIALRRDTALSTPIATYTITEAIAAQPDLSGYGNLLDLHQALAKEEAALVAAGGTAGSGPLATALAAYLAASAVGSGGATPRDIALDTLLYTWAGVADTLLGTRGNFMNATQVAFLEKLFAQTLGNPDSNAAVQWGMSWQAVREYYGASLLAQTTLKPLFDEIQYRWDDQSQTLKSDLSAVEALLQDGLIADPVTGTAQLADFARAIKGLGAQDSVNYLALRETFFEQDPELAWAMDSAGMKLFDQRNQGDWIYSPHLESSNRSGEALRDTYLSGDNYLNSLNGNDTLWGNPRDEVLISESGDSLLYGGGGSDRLMAGTGDDILDGGTGNDILQGEAGNDTYVFRKGSGVDRVKGWNAGDKVWLATNPDELTMRRSQNDLAIGFVSAPAKLIVELYFAFAPTNGGVIVFRDGTTWNNDALANWFADRTGGAGADLLVGGDAAERLDGGGGNDRLVGGGGSNTLIGGTGDRSCGGKCECANEEWRTAA